MKSMYLNRFVARASALAMTLGIGIFVGLLPVQAGANPGCDSCGSSCCPTTPPHTQLCCVQKDSEDCQYWEWGYCITNFRDSTAQIPLWAGLCINGTCQ